MRRVQAPVKGHIPVDMCASAQNFLSLPKKFISFHPEMSDDQPAKLTAAKAILHMRLTD